MGFLKSLKGIFSRSRRERIRQVQHYIPPNDYSSQPEIISSPLVEPDPTSASKLEHRQLAVSGAPVSSTSAEEEEGPLKSAEPADSQADSKDSKLGARRIINPQLQPQPSNTAAVRALGALSDSKQQARLNENVTRSGVVGQLGMKHLPNFDS